MAEGGTRVTNAELLERIPKRDWSQVLAKEQLELERRISTYREGREIESTGKTVILVDDGLATGATMLAAVKAVKQKRPRRVVVAAPVGARTRASRCYPKLMR